MYKKIENKQLLKTILNALNKSDSEDFSEEELLNIENIGFIERLSNGKATNIKVEDVLLFKNLKSLTLRRYTLTMEDLNLISKYTNIEDISFLECSFPNVDFDELPRMPKTLKFMRCSALPTKFPRIRNIVVSFSEIDFDSISFSDAISIRINNSKIRNIHDIDTYDNILEVDFDGSELLKSNGEKVKDINVASGCNYTHEDIDLQYVDNFSEYKVEEDLER